MNQASMLAGSPTNERNRLVAAGAIEHAVEQVDVALFLGEEMVQRQAAEVAVLQLGQLVEEDDRAAVAVAVEQGELALRLFPQRRPQQRQYRRNS